jgi:CysZ protein
MTQPTPNLSKPIRRGPGSLLTGASYPFRALWLFARHSKFRGYVLTPILINVLLGITLYAGMLFLGFRAIDAIIADLPRVMENAPHLAVQFPQWQVSLPDWHLSLPQWHLSFPTWFRLPDWLVNLSQWRPNLPDWVASLPRGAAIVFLWLLRFLLTLILLFVTGFILLQFGVLLGSPWYGKLSEEIEKMRTGQLVLIEVGLTQDIGRAILYELKKLVIAVGIGIPLLALSLFPGIGTLLATIIGVIVAATLVCLDFFDSPLERRRLRFRQKLGILWSSLPASATFGLICFGLVSIPFINLLAIPLCVAAGTMFVCDRVLPTLPNSQPD